MQRQAISDYNYLQKMKEAYSMLQRTAGGSCSLKQTTEDIWTRLSDIILGSWFHCGIVYGKNECLYVSLDVWICLNVRGVIFSGPCVGDY